MNITTESLRNGLHFPSFRSTPHENDIDESYYTIQPNMVYHPKKHWCFFGEIKSLSNFNRLRLEVQDSNGDVIPVAFHMQRPGMRIFTPDMTVYSEIQKYNVKFKVGHTFAYLYAQQHDFLDGSCGFRIEEEGHFKASTSESKTTVLLTPFR